MGIFFDNAKAAALNLNQIHANIEDWWRDKERERAVKRLTNRFFKRASADLQEWHAMFKRLYRSEKNG